MIFVPVRPRLAIAGLLTLAGCRLPKQTPAPVPSPAPPIVSPTLRIFLIGDGGEPRTRIAPDGRRIEDPVLAALRAGIAADSAPAAVVFLGDNVYYDGLPADTTSAAYQRAASALRDQVAATAGARAGVLFVPGNHDHRSKGIGHSAGRLQAQARILARLGDSLGARVAQLPAPDCPGPERFDVDVPGARLRVLAIDSNWWLLAGRRRDAIAAAASCPLRTTGAVTTALKTELASADGRLVIVAAHHPIVSHGPHGERGLVARFYPQDLAHRRYRALRVMLADAFASAPPLVYAAGHEHVLQVYQDAASRTWLLGSGTGMGNHVSGLKVTPETRFGASRPGFMRLDVAADGAVRLGVFAAEGEGRQIELCSFYLRGGSEGRQSCR